VATDVTNTIESQDQFKNTPAGWAKRWQTEIKAAQKQFESFHKRGDQVIARYGDDRDKDEERTDSRVNMFWSSTNTLMSILYSNLPAVDVGRKFSDHNDDIGRVAALMMQRILDYDIADNGKEYTNVLRQVVQDRLLPGLGAARLYYEFDSETIAHEALMDEEDNELAPAYEEESIENEKVTCEYHYWGDVLWGWSRTWGDVPWVAFRNYLTKEEVKERFGEDHVKSVKFKNATVSNSDSDGDKAEEREVWQKAEIWEIWDKSTATVYWWSDGVDKILDKKEDPLELRGFLPCPQFWLANVTTSFCMPKPDFIMFQDLLNEIDILHTRISILTEAVKVVGVYDRSSDGVQRMLMEGTENELIPVDNWAMFAEKGGLQGQIDWLPVEAVVNAIIQLRTLREDNIILLEKVSGMSDIIQGQGTHPREGVGTQELKAEYGSIRIQAMQEELAQFATDVLELKAEIISRHCSPESILAMANAQFMDQNDHQFIEPAIALLKDWDNAAIRIKVRSESMAMIDYSRLRRERTEFITNMALFMQSAAPLVQVEPGVTPYLLDMLKWGMAGFKGSMEIEGTLDAAIEAAKKAKQKPDPDEGKNQAELQKEQMRIQGEIQKIQVKLKADMQILQAKFQAKMQEIQAKAVADQQKEEAQAMFSGLEKEMETMFDGMIAEAESQLRIKEIEAQGRNAGKSDG
jgi:hypothetical protein